MENLIKHFKEYSEGIKPGKGFTYNAVEAPKRGIRCCLNFRRYLPPLSM